MKYKIVKIKEHEELFKQGFVYRIVQASEQDVANMNAVKRFISNIKEQAVLALYAKTYEDYYKCLENIEHYNNCIKAFGKEIGIEYAHQNPFV